VVLNQDKTKSQKIIPFDKKIYERKYFDTLKVNGTLKVIIINNIILFLKMK
jgi:hypothetical protein